VCNHVCRETEEEGVSGMKDIHPSQLPDGPERTVWLEAETRYMFGDKPPPAMLGIAPMLPKLGAMAWLRRAYTWMMK